MWLLSAVKYHFIMRTRVQIMFLCTSYVLADQWFHEIDLSNLIYDAGFMVCWGVSRLSITINKMFRAKYLANGCSSRSFHEHFGPLFQLVFHTVYQNCYSGLIRCSCLFLHMLVHSWFSMDFPLGRWGRKTDDRWMKCRTSYTVLHCCLQRKWENGNVYHVPEFHNDNVYQMYIVNLHLYIYITCTYKMYILQVYIYIYMYISNVYIIFIYIYKYYKRIYYK